ncbi:hypothetical protein NQ315_006111 [Exocentrus adspersus]|uniref:Uncharacterized protein n=1 Tax=Exocentrus adspersus TaxID=1586481 RepID=A0AAV8VE23_9CUCU|nr:hypothetical protein NQ315_006111 [Exocentrus adspersus]
MLFDVCKVRITVYENQPKNKKVVTSNFTKNLIVTFLLHLSVEIKILIFSFYLKFYKKVYENQPKNKKVVTSNFTKNLIVAFLLHLSVEIKILIFV